MFKKVITSAAVSTVLMFSNLSHAESYIGVGFGSTDYSVDTSALLASVGVNSFSEDVGGSGSQIYYGFKLNPSLALELSYTDLGETTSSGSGTFQNTPINVGITQELSAVGAAFVYTFNSEGSFKPYVKGGINRLNLDVSVTTSSATASANVSDSTSGTDFMYGLGFDASVSDAFSIRVGYELFKVDSSTIDDVSLVSAGLNYKF